MNQAFDLFTGNLGKNFLSVEHAGNVREIDQLFGADVFRARRGHMIGVDVVKLIVRSDAKARSDGQKSFPPERLDELQIQSREIANEAKAACDFVVDHGLGDKTLSVRRGDANGRMS